MNRHPYLVCEPKTEFVDSSGHESMGGLDWLVVLVLMGAGILSAFSPWSFFIGGRFTPLAQWTGYGKMHSAAGRDYGLFLRLDHHQSDDVANAFQTTPNLRGSAILCTPQGERYDYQLKGTIRDAWLQTEGSATGLTLVTLNPQPQQRTLGPSVNDLHGVWRHGSLVLEDSSLATSAPASRSKSRQGKRNSVRNSGHNTTVVSFGDLSAFNDFCRNQIATATRQARLISKPSPSLRQ